MAGLVALFASRPSNGVRTVSPAPSPGFAADSLQGAIDLPADRSTLDGASYVIGWAVDPGAQDGTGVDRVQVYLDGGLVGDAHYGFARDDIAAAYGERFRASGWQALLDLATLTTPGDHHLEVRLHSVVSGSERVFAQTLTVRVPQLFGVNDHPLRFDIQTAASALDQVRANSLTSMRLDVNWAALEPDAAGSWDATYLARLDDVLALAVARGIRPILVVLTTPAWARNGTGSSMTPPLDPEAYARVVGMLARRYANHAGIAYEVWNEPNQHQFWDNASGTADPAAYTRLLRSAYAAIKANSPAATVLGGSVAYDDPAFLESMYAAGAAGAFDGLALHPYSGKNPPGATNDPSQSFVLAIDQAQATLAAHGEANKPIWITEMGWSLSDVSDQTRAEYLREAVAIVRARPNVAAFCAYTLDQTNDDANYGLLRAGGVPTQSWLSYGQAVAPQ